MSTKAKNPALDNKAQIAERLKKAREGLGLTQQQVADKRMRASKDHNQARINEITRQLKILEERQQRLLEAVENGTIELDEITQRRAQQNQAAREALLIEQAGMRRRYAVPGADHIKPSQVEAFGRILRDKLLAKDSSIAKSYVVLLVEGIVVTEKAATMTGSHAAVASTLQVIAGGKVDQVPSLLHKWRARRDLNPRPLASEANTLSS